MKALEEIVVDNIRAGFKEADAAKDDATKAVIETNTCDADSPVFIGTWGECEEKAMKSKVA